MYPKRAATLSAHRDLSVLSYHCFIRRGKSIDDVANKSGGIPNKTQLVHANNDDFVQNSKFIKYALK